MPAQAVDDKLGINERLKLKPLELVRMIPRRYQTELSLIALRENVIIYLGTGLGKTFITTLYLTFPQVDELIQNGRKVVFLAPTQDLVKQQAEYLNKQLPYRVKVFCGRSARIGVHIDYWSAEAWRDEIAQLDLLFMTPQIFASAINTNLLSWTQFAAIIFDEVHHACRTSKMKESCHPYAQIIAHYNAYYRNRPDPVQHVRPRLIGLTASLINNMPKDRQSIVDQVRYLESILKARCITDTDVQENKPKMEVHIFSSYNLDVINDVLISMLFLCVEELNNVLKINKVKRIQTMKSNALTKEDERMLAYYNRLKLAAAGFSIKPGSFPKVIDGLIKIRQRCGLWAMRAICKRLIEALTKHDKNSSIRQELKNIYNSFNGMLQLMEANLGNFLALDPDQGLLKYTRPKCLTLLQTLKSEYSRTMDVNDKKSSFSCIIFVRSRLEVLALNLWLQQVSNTMPEYHFIRCDYAIGIAATMSSKYACITKRKSTDQYQMLSDFRKGCLNVIVTTSVLEEGIDLPSCSTVIRYDQPNTFREYVQSRGRARQSISSYISLCESSITNKLTDKLNKFNDFEFVLKGALSDSDIRPMIQNSELKFMPKAEEMEDFLLINNEKVRISSTTAKTILNMYCQRLSLATPFTEGIRFDRLTPSSETFQTILYLPSGCPLDHKGIAGNVKSTPLGADNSAAVAAVKALYEAKELDEHGIPTRISPQNIDALLETANLKVDFALLEKQHSDGRLVKEDSVELFMFEPQCAKIGSYMSKNFQNRKYKLLRIDLKPHQHVRNETKPYFEHSVYGLLVDSSTPNSFIENHLYTHYGQFKVETLQISDNIILNESQHHNIYLNFTFKFLTRCLGLKKTNREEFRYHCLFYILILDEANNPDFDAMRNSFINTSQRTNSFQAGNIVKLRHYYHQTPNNSRNRNDRPEDRLLLVRAVHNNLNANSRIPGHRRGVTFLQDCEYKYGRNVITRMDQPVIEVMPISKDFGQKRDIKSKRTNNYVTESNFYLEQFLEFFNDKPASVFQAYTIPEHIYNLYKISQTCELDQKFIEHSKDSRDVVLYKNSSEPSDLAVRNMPLVPMDEDPIEDLIEEEPLIEMDTQDQPERDTHGEQPASLEGASGDTPGENVGGNSDGNDDDDNSSIATNDTIFSDDGEEENEEDNVELVGKRYRDLIGKKRLVMDDGGDGNFERWDVSQYQAPDLKRMNFEFKHFNNDTYSETVACQSEVFHKLKSNMMGLQGTLVNLLEGFNEILTSDATFLDEESEFAKRSCVVDHNIVSDFKFDMINKQVISSERIAGLQEALTLKRALESYNMECLENIGDSYLKYMTSVILYQRLEGSEGFLTVARSRWTCNKHFALLSRKMNLGAYAVTKPSSKELIFLLLGQQMQDADKMKYYNRLKPKQMADLFESILGSYLIYQGEYEAILAIKWLGLNMIDDKTFSEFHANAVVFSRCPTALFDRKEAHDIYPSYTSKMKRIEHILGYEFKDPSYLIQAFTHASNTQKCTRSYERLEFLGDALIDYMITMSLVISGKMKTPGQITSSRSALVNNCAFAKLAIKYKFDLMIQHSNHELYDEMTNLIINREDDPEMNFLDMTNFDKIVKLLGDVFESVAGAIYLDSGCSLDAVWSVYYPILKENIDSEIETPTKNAAALLYETFPGNGRINFESYDFKLDDGSILIEVKCSIVGYQDYIGRGLTRKQAKMRAIQEAVKNLPSEEVRARLDKNYRDQFPSSTVGRGGGRRGRGGCHNSSRGNQQRQYNPRNRNQGRPRGFK